MMDDAQPTRTPSQKAQHTASKPLETRHVFLDTEVYHKLKHNVANGALKLLAQHVADHLIALHVTDIMLAEIKRQITEDIDQSRAALARVEKDLRRWRFTDNTIGATPKLTGATASALFDALASFLKNDCRAKTHQAMAYPAADVFADYFDRQPPFDKGDKEFPDAFMVKTLDAWCAAHSEYMYVVTQDKAMQRYVEASPRLLLLPSLDAVLAAARATAETDDGAEVIADELLNAPNFDTSLERAIDSHVDDLIIDYAGDLPEGEVTSVGFEGVIQFVDYRIVAKTSTRLSLLFNIDAEITASVAYEDRHLAMYDREDDQWIGAEWETTEVKDGITLEMFVEIEIASGRFVNSELLRTEYTIYR
ncbi:MAG: PIN domain-containing protein [Erythrobacter sp.]|uniref:PIN domain-containing protein n=1 Tax=Erythrobacter sp. TaxID=1042 RepID=UPI003C742C51